MSDSKDLANAVIAYRAEHGLTQPELAKILGITPQTVVNIEKGHHNPWKITEYKVRKLLGILEA